VCFAAPFYQLTYNILYLNSSSIFNSKTIFLLLLFRFLILLLSQFQEGSSLPRVFARTNAPILRNSPCTEFAYLNAFERFLSFKSQFDILLFKKLKWCPTKTFVFEPIEHKEPKNISTTDGSYCIAKVYNQYSQS